MKSRLRENRLRPNEFEEEEANPMAGVSNLADVMLVLAVGIMLALVINWNIDVGSDSTVTEVDTEDLTEIEEYESVTEEELSEITSDTGLEEKGTVLVDPETGKYYILMPEE